MFTGSSFADDNVPNMAVTATMILRLAIAIGRKSETSVSYEVIGFDTLLGGAEGMIWRQARILLIIYGET